MAVPSLLSLRRPILSCTPCSALPTHPSLLTRRPIKRIRQSVRVEATAATASATHTATGPFAVFKKWHEWWYLESPQTQKDPSAPRTAVGPLLSKLGALCAPDKWLMVAATVFMVVAAVSELAIPHFVTKSIFAAGTQGASSESFTMYLKLLSGIVVIFGVTAAARGYCFSILNNRMTMRLRGQLFANLVRREMAFFDKTEVGSLASRLQADCQAITKCIGTNLNIALRNFLQAAGGLLYLFLLSKQLCLVTIGVSAVLVAVTLVYGDFSRRTAKVNQDVLACSSQVAEEALSLSRVVRTFGTEAREEARYKNWLERLYEVGLRQASGYSLFVMAGQIACYSSKVVALALGCAMVLQGTLSAEQLTNYIFYVEFVTYSSLNVCDEFTEFMEAVGASERVLNLLDNPPAQQISMGRVLPTFQGHFEFKDVTFRYPSRPNYVALNNVSLQLQPNRVLALVGMSGSGKSSLVALLQRLYDPDEGAVLLDGVDLREVDAAWYRSQIGVVSQEPRLFSTSVAENIIYGCEGPQPSQADIEEAAQQANAHDFIMALPQGYDTQVTDKLLSGGQKQRIALARALVRKPKLLVLDEATSALDAESEAQVQAALDQVMSAGGRTILVIAHRLSTVRSAHTIIVMDKGQVSEMGSHKQLLQRRGIYWQLVRRQQYEPAESGMAAAPAAAATAAAAVRGDPAMPPVFDMTATAPEELPQPSVVIQVPLAGAASPAAPAPGQDGHEEAGSSNSNTSMSWNGEEDSLTHEDMVEAGLVDVQDFAAVGK